MSTHADQTAEWYCLIVQVPGNYGRVHKTPAHAVEHFQTLAGHRSTLGFPTPRGEVHGPFKNANLAAKQGSPTSTSRPRPIVVVPGYTETGEPLWLRRCFV